MLSFFMCCLLRYFLNFLVIIPLGANRSEHNVKALKHITIVGPVGKLVVLLLTSTPDTVEIKHIVIEIKIIWLNRFVHCLAAVPGAIISALVKITPTD